MYNFYLCVWAKLISGFVPHLQLRNKMMSNNKIKGEVGRVKEAVMANLKTKLS
jgi:hypothetical protein